MLSMNALAWVGLFIIVGVILRAKVPFLKKNLVPASVIGGVIGFIVVNLGVLSDATVNDFSGIAGTLWSFSFANMGLTLAVKTKKKTTGKTLKERMEDSRFSGGIFNRSSDGA